MDIWHSEIPPTYRDTITVTDALAGLRSLPDASIPLFLFSPPYNLGTSTGGGIQAYKSHYGPDLPLGKRGGRGDRGKCRWAGGNLANGYDDYNDALPHAEYVQWQKDILTECWRCLTPTGAIYYNHKPRIMGGRLAHPLTEYIPAGPVYDKDGKTANPAELDLRPYIRQCVTWARSGGVNATPAFYMSTHECLVIIARPGFRLRDQSASAVGDVWQIHQRPSWHPAPFPLSLALRVMETTGARLVVDPFAGSGTTGKAAKMCGAHWIGFDRNAAYVARANAETLAIEPFVFTPEHEQIAMAV